MVTARNKMRHATKVKFDMSLDKELIETTRLPLSSVGLATNTVLVSSWLDSISREHGDPTDDGVWGMTGWAGIPKYKVGDLLREFRAHPMNHQFQGDPLADFLLETTEERLSRWEVRIRPGHGRRRSTSVSGSPSAPGSDVSS
jgi:hypothetical protein